MLFTKLSDLANRYRGNADFLEAVAAAVALVAAVGGISKTEEDIAIKHMTGNKLLSDNYSNAQIERVLNKMFDKIEKGGRSSRAELRKEIRECVAKDPSGEMAEAVMLIALDVADHGGIDAEEETMLRSIAADLGVNYDKVAGM